MLDVITDRRARLKQARADHAANEAALQELEASKSEASKAGREAFALWREEFDWRGTERERGALLIETLERELAEEDSAAAEADLRDRYEVRRTANEDLAKRAVSNLRKANELYIATIREAAMAAIENAAINAALPPDLEPLVSVDVLARSRPGLPRQEIGRERVWLWARSDNHAIVGDQDAVENRGGGKGLIKSKYGPPIRCVHLCYEEIHYHPAQPGERPVPLWQVLLVDPNGPRSQFDGTELRHPREVLLALDRTQQARHPGERPVEVEIVPLDRAAPQDELTSRIKEGARL